MPIYEYVNDDTGESIEVVQTMNEKHEYRDEKGKEWRRVFFVPKMSVDTKLNAFSKKDFLKKTAKSGTVGDLMDLSKEMSEKRKDKEGIDSVKEKYMDDWSKRRKNRIHPGRLADSVTI